MTTLHLGTAARPLRRDVLRAYLWKEAREQRGVLLAIAALVPLACLALVVLLPEWARQSADDLVSRVTVGTVLGVIALVATELVPAEAQRGKLALLERLPAGLATAFAAKLLVLLAALVGGALYGYAIAAAIAGVLFDAATTPVVAGERALPLLVAVTLGCAAWVLAVSCWLPRGSLALPGTAMVVALTLLPFVPLVVLGDGPWLWFTWVGIGGITPFGWWWIVLQAPVALLVACVSFVRGRRCGGSHARAGVVGALTAAAALAPLYAIALWRTHDLRRFDPLAAQANVERAWLGGDGRHAFLNVAHDGKVRGLRLDLQTRAWQLLDPFERFVGSVPGAQPDAPFSQRGQHALIFSQGGADPWAWLRRGSASLPPVVTVWAGGSGEVLRRDVLPFVEDDWPLLRAERRTSTTLRLPDGRRVWFYRGELEADAVGGSGVDRLPWDRSWVPGHAAGFGFQVARRSPLSPRHEVYDLVRRARFDPRRMPALRRLWPKEVHDVLVLPQGWLVAIGAPGDRRRLLVDPTTGMAREALGLDARHHLGGVVDDGRLIAALDPPARDAASGEWRAARLVDPWTGASTELRWADGRPVPQARLQAMWTPDGARLVHANGMWARLDAASGTLHLVLEEGQPIGFADARRVVYMAAGDGAGRRLMLRDVHAGTSEVVWPPRVRR